MPTLLTYDQIRELCLALGSAVRAAGVWGMERSSGGDVELAERAIHHWVDETLKVALQRNPNDAERAWVWET